MTAKSKRHQAKPQARQPIRRHKGRTREGGNRIATKASDSEFAAIKPERKQAKTNEWQPSRLHKRGSQLEATANKNDRVTPILGGFHRAPTRQKIERQPQTCASSIGTGSTLALPRACFLVGKNRRATRACTASTRIWLSRSRCPAVCGNVRGNRRHTQNRSKIRPKTQGQRERNAKNALPSKRQHGGNRRVTRKKHKKT